MRKISLCLILIVVSFISCKEQHNDATLVFNDLKQFPQEIIITQYSKNFVIQTDTIQVNTKEDAQISFAVDRPKYVYVQKTGETLQFYLKPGARLNIIQDNDGYKFEGDLKPENEYIQEIQNNQELRQKAWNYDLPFDDFKKQVEEYFAFKGQLLNEHFPAKEKNHFYRLNLMDDRAFKNLAVLDYIGTRLPEAERDSMFFKFLDKDLLNFKHMEAYLDAGRLRSFYSKKGVEFFMRKKHGKELDSVRKQKELYVFRDDIISEYFDQPLKSILIYDDLRYYPEEFDFAPDSLISTSPREMLDRYRESLHEEAYTSLLENFDLYEAKKKRYAEGTSMPKFLLKDQSNQAYELDPATFDKLVLVDVWASWCGPCIRKFPKVRELEKQYSDQLDVISISIDYKFDPYKEGLNKLQVPGRLKLYAENAFTSDFAKHFQVTAIPRYILVSQNGRIVDPNVDLADIESILKTDF